MVSVTIEEAKLNKVLQDVETLIEDVTSLLDQDAIAKQRLANIKKDPSIGIAEDKLDNYFAKRGVSI